MTFRALAFLLTPAEASRAFSVVEVDQSWEFDAEAIDGADVVLWGRPPLPSGTDRGRALIPQLKHHWQEFADQTVANYTATPVPTLIAVLTDLRKDLGSGEQLEQVFTTASRWRERLKS